MRDVADAMRADMAEHQRMMGKEPTDDANARLVGPELEKLEKSGMLARAESNATAKPAPMPARPAGTIFTERVLNGERTYKVKHELEHKPLVRRASAEEAWFYAHAMPRIELLITKVETGPRGQPSWNQRVMAVMATKNKAVAWQAAADNPSDLVKYREQLWKHQELLKAWGLESISQLTPGFARAKQHELEQQFVNELCLLLEESNVVFGDWKADPGPRISVQVQ